MTAPTVTIKPQARLDLLEAFAYIGERDLPAAERFTGAAERAFDQLATMPGMGRRRAFANPDLADLRSWTLGGFPTPTGIDVLRVLHDARDIDALFGP